MRTDTEPQLSSYTDGRNGPKPNRRLPLMPRVEAKTVRTPDGCWLWTGGKDRKGYGHICWNGDPWLVHRAVYTHLVGDIPEGLVLDHLCEQKACCNPEHLEPVNHEANLLRSPTNIAAQNARKTHCPAGHEYTPENTIVRQKTPQSGQLGYSRFCRKCAQIRTWEMYQQQVRVVCDDCGWQNRRMPGSTLPCPKCGSTVTEFEIRRAA